MYHKRKYSHRIRERNIVLLERNRNGWNLIPGSYDLQSNHRVIERYIYTHVTWKTEIQIRIIINRTYIRAECVLPFEMEDNPSGNLAFVDKKEKKKYTTCSFPRSRYRIFTIHSSRGDTTIVCTCVTAYPLPRIYTTQPPVSNIGRSNKERKYNAD